MKLAWELRNTISDLLQANKALQDALKAFVDQAESYHSLCHGPDDTYSASKCDGICACLPAAKAALAKAGSRS